MERDEDEEKSRTQKKREAEALQTLGKQLVSLSEDQIKALELPEKLEGAVIEAKRIKKHEALRRQMQYIGGLMRSVDPEPIQAVIDDIATGRAQEASKHKLIEDLRDGLISGKKGLEEDVLRNYPEMDRQHLSQLIRNARKEKETGKPPKSARILFRKLREIVADERF
ncbi:DUF615 domain-containing protein [bacterium]|nr:DUF615 domain-containing protein [bacterium]